MQQRELDGPAAPRLLDLRPIVIELDQAKAPVSAENFLKYVRSGRFDTTIIHRAPESTPGPEVIQGGVLGVAGSFLGSALGVTFAKLFEVMTADAAGAPRFPVQVDLPLLLGTMLPMYVLMAPDYHPVLPVLGRDPGASQFPFATPFGDVPLPWWIVAVAAGVLVIAGGAAAAGERWPRQRRRRQAHRRHRRPRLAGQGAEARRS